MLHAVYLALGSNLGDRHGSIERALEELASYVTITARSTVIETAAQYDTDQPPFLNGVCAGTTAASPEALLTALHTIEEKLGRVRTTRYGPRTIDIDILIYGTLVQTNAVLTLPHPRMQERLFVLEPLNQIAPDLIVPGSAHTVRELYELCRRHTLAS
jgi:2-amino-4-hydroxy-6-hydroxymethyldihydropteridine diphosphokinase